MATLLLHDGYTVVVGLLHGRDTIGPCILQVRQLKAEMALEKQRAEQAMHAATAEATSKLLAADAARASAERQLQTFTSQQAEQVAHLHEAQALATASQNSKVEAAEQQLQRLRSEIASLKSSHAVEVATLKEGHEAELAAQKRAHQESLASLEQSVERSSQLGGLIEQVQGAVSAVNRVQKEVQSDRAATVDQRQLYQESRATALSQQAH